MILNQIEPLERHFHEVRFNILFNILVKKKKGKVIPLQARCGPEGG